MPIEIEGLKRGWTSTSAIAVHKSPFAGLGVIKPSPPAKMTDGLRVSVHVESNRRIPLAEFNILLLPVLEALNLEVIGKPELVVEDSPIWVWRKYAAGEREDLIRADPNDRSPTFIATLAAGPLKGHESEWLVPTSCLYRGKWTEQDILRCKVGVPTAEDTAELAKIVERWSVRLRRRMPTENLKSKERQVDRALTEPLEKLATFTKSPPVSSVVQAQVPVPKAKARGGAVATAAIIGIALSLLTWSQRRA